MDYIECICRGLNQECNICGGRGFLPDPGDIQDPVPSDLEKRKNIVNTLVQAAAGLSDHQLNEVTNGVSIASIYFNYSNAQLEELHKSISRILQKNREPSTNVVRKNIARKRLIKYSRLVRFKKLWDRLFPWTEFNVDFLNVKSDAEASLFYKEFNNSITEKKFNSLVTKRIIGNKKKKIDLDVLRKKILSKVLNKYLTRGTLDSLIQKYS